LLVSEYLPALGDCRLQMVLLHGWGCNREIWRPLVSRLRQSVDLTLLEFPGNAQHATTEVGIPTLVADPDALVADALALAPRQAVYVGWSLGGMLAAKIAATAPDRVAGLITVCSNACFIQKESKAGELTWPGMGLEVFESFCAELTADTRRGLQHFHSLQSQGSRNRAALNRALRALPGEAHAPSLSAGLALLKDMDVRADLAGLAGPQMHLLASEDALVPRALGPYLEKLAAGAQCRVLEGYSHALPLEAPQQVYQAVHDFCGEQQLLSDKPAAAPAMDKGDVARSFSRAAAGYDSVASLQRSVGKQLLSQLPAKAPVSPSILDMGCGTGYFLPQLQQCYPSASLVALDLASGMVSWARSHHVGSAGWLVADAESLPLAASSVDVIFSSLVIQWCHRPELLWAEVSRVLRPGGSFVFATLGPGTLAELRRAWAAVDGAQHVNNFAPLETHQQVVNGDASLELSCQQQIFTMQYDRVRELLDELKGLGAHNMNRGRATGLTGRRQLQGMLAAYEAERRDGKLPASYHVIFGKANKL